MQHRDYIDKNQALPICLLFGYIFNTLFSNLSGPGAAGGQVFNPSAAFMADPSSLLRLNAAAAAAAQLNPAAALRLMGPAALGQSQPNGNPLFVQQVHTTTSYQGGRKGCAKAPPKKFGIAKTSAFSSNAK